MDHGQILTKGFVEASVRTEGQRVGVGLLRSGQRARSKTAL